MNPKQIQLELTQFFGSEVLYKHFLTDCLITEGVIYLAEVCKSWWLITDAIIQARAFKDEAFIVISLKKNTFDTGCVITYDNGNEEILKTVKIPFTDFPLNVIKLYFTNNTLLLPTEY